MISVVNGFVCRSGCDVLVAREGHDPRNPTDNPVKREQLALRDDGASALWSASRAAVRFDRESSTVAGAGAEKPSVAADAPGSVIDLFA